MCNDADCVSMGSADTRTRNQHLQETTTKSADASHSCSDSSERSLRYTGILRKEVTSGGVHLPSKRSEQVAELSASMCFVVVIVAS
jgi:hypothetical protein